MMMIFYDPTALSCGTDSGWSGVIFSCFAAFASRESLSLLAVIVPVSYPTIGGVVGSGGI